MIFKNIVEFCAWLHDNHPDSKHGGLHKTIVDYTNDGELLGYFVIDYKKDEMSFEYKKGNE